MEECGILVISSLKVNDPFFNITYKYIDNQCMVKEGVDYGKSGCLYEITYNSLNYQ